MIYSFAPEHANPTLRWLGLERLLKYPTFWDLAACGAVVIAEVVDFARLLLGPGLFVARLVAEELTC